jgi:hypothetical protein
MSMSPAAFASTSGAPLLGRDVGGHRRDRHADARSRMACAVDSSASAPRAFSTRSTPAPPAPRRSRAPALSTAQTSARFRNRPPCPPEIARRRTFAIISHPDAGKTTLTEKFLLFGGAIQMAGQVRAKGEARRTRSDFMKMEQERGISVSASAMSFDLPGIPLQPGRHARPQRLFRGHLPHADGGGCRDHGDRRRQGRRSQTRKLFEVCRLRDLPILTFCNKMDRESRDTFEIIDEIQENLAIDVTPAAGPSAWGAISRLLRHAARPAGTDGPRRPQPRGENRSRSTGSTTRSWPSTCRRPAGQAARRG